ILAFEFQILWNVQRSKRKNLAFLTQCRITVDHHVTVQNAARAQLYLWTNYTIRADLAALADLSALGNNRSRVNLRRHSGLSMIIAEKIASACSWPPTLASPLNFQTLPRL